MGKIEASVSGWATEAADAFLKRQVPLNSSIGKIAEREHLNREKVARVVEEANRQVFLNRFPNEPDKRFTFAVADTDDIVGPSKTAAAGVPVAMVRVSPAAAKPMVKTASQRETEIAFGGTGIQVAQDYYEKALLAVEMLREKAAMDREKLADAELEFATVAQNMVALDDYTYEQIFKTASSLHPKHAKRIAMLLKAAALHQGRNFKLPDMPKVASPVDPGEHEISDTLACLGMPVEIVNGTHRLIVALDTIVNQVTESDRSSNGLVKADDSVRYLRKGITNYLSSHRSA